jgi:hypothetical protein
VFDSRRGGAREIVRRLRLTDRHRAEARQHEQGGSESTGFWRYPISFGIASTERVVARPKRLTNRGLDSRKSQRSNFPSGASSTPWPIACIGHDVDTNSVRKETS